MAISTYSNGLGAIASVMFQYNVFGKLDNSGDTFTRSSIGAGFVSAMEQRWPNGFDQIGGGWAWPYIYVVERGTIGFVGSSKSPWLSSLSLTGSHSPGQGGGIGIDSLHPIRYSDPMPASNTSDTTGSTPWTLLDLGLTGDWAGLWVIGALSTSFVADWQFALREDQDVLCGVSLSGGSGVLLREHLVDEQATVQNSLDDVVGLELGSLGIAADVVSQNGEFPIVVPGRV